MWLQAEMHEPKHAEYPSACILLLGPVPPGPEPSDGLLQHRGAYATGTSSRLSTPWYFLPSAQPSASPGPRHLPQPSAAQDPQRGECQ